MLRLASPAARRIVENAMPSDIRAFVGRAIQRKLCATWKALPLAPIAPRICGRNGSASRLTVAPITAISVAPEVASRRASSCRRAPSARETRAPIGIINPTLMEMVKNITTVATPTPAVMLGSLSQEM